MLTEKQRWDFIKYNEGFTIEWCQAMIKLKEKDIALCLDEIEKFKEIIMYKSGLNP